MTNEKMIISNNDKLYINKIVEQHKHVKVANNHNFQYFHLTYKPTKL